jgi:small neutral amino acid transporter SnatA (MarC family)
MTEQFIKAGLLLFLLLNPFLVILYMVDLVQNLSPREFARSLFHAGAISACVFIVFAILGEAIFRDILQARFASFQVFGGIIFLMIGIQFVFQGDSAISGLRGEATNIAGSIAMPIMIGPGTVSASVLAGKQLPVPLAALCIAGVVFLSISLMILLKYIHDLVIPRNEQIIQRYIEVTGRIMALVVGTFAIEMIMRGVFSWIAVGMQ